MWPNPQFPADFVTFTEEILNGKLHFLCSAGAKIKQLSYHAAPSLVDETPKIILFYGGCNDVSIKTSTLENIAKNLLEMAKTCRGCGVNDIFISSIICWRNKFLNEKVQRVKLLLKVMFEENEYIYIDNGNVEVGDLRQDGIHLSEYGKAKLSRLFIYSLNAFCWNWYTYKFRSYTFIKYLGSFKREQLWIYFNCKHSK